MFSQLLSAVFSVIAGMRKFHILRLHRADFLRLSSTVLAHLKTGAPMGLQMSVMCIGQLAMQGSVNMLGPEAIAGYTAATKADQVSVLVNNAMGIAISSYVAQNHGAGLTKRIRSGVTACLAQTSIANVAMCALIILCRRLVVPMFVTSPTAEIAWYSDQYLLTVAPFYLLLGVLLTYRSSIQSMGYHWPPFAACMIELFVRIGATVLLANRIGYIGVCLASPLAWLGASLLLLPVYRKAVGKAR